MHNCEMTQSQLIILFFRVGNICWICEEQPVVFVMKYSNVFIFGVKFCAFYRGEIGVDFAVAVLDCCGADCSPT